MLVSAFRPSLFTAGQVIHSFDLTSNMSPPLRFDRIGWTYAGLEIAWNVLLVAGMIFLWRHRQMPSLRMRKLPLLFTGVLSLHVYGALCLLAYPVGSAFSCTTEFWMMSIYLPLGVALFQAANTQFLHHASRQKQFARVSTLAEHQAINVEQAQQLSNSRWKRTIAGFRQGNRVGWTLVCIGIGLIVQFGLTLFVFLGSKKFHPSFGLFNYTVKGTGMEVRFNCSKGWEWWLSIVWQIFWTWIYAPYILWKSRDYKDVHGWRTQTICCCLAGLPASPLWLSGLYAPQFAPLNAVFAPPVWFSLCIFFIEVFAIGFPIIDTLKGNSLRQETLEAIANWEARQIVHNADNSSGIDGPLKSPTALSMTTTLKSTGDLSIGKMSFDSQKSHILTMTAMENALRTNPRPLLEFAALKDFSGENISFLTHIADWRRDWLVSQDSTAERRRKQFVSAARIYAHFISLEFSEFPVNISSKEMKRLHRIFETAAAILNRKRTSIDSQNSDSVTPFDAVVPEDTLHIPCDSNSCHGSEVELKKGMNLDSLGRANLKAVSRIQDLCIDALAGIDIPESFSEIVFESAEVEIKYLVLTNTWPKFVNLNRSNSQLNNQADEEKGHAWMSKLLCSSG